MAMTNEEALETQTLVPTWSRNCLWAVQCKRIKANGERCKKWAIRGGYVCWKHGGAQGMTQQAAKRRIVALVPIAVGALAEVLQEGDDAAKLRAARLIIRFADVDLSLTRQPRYKRALAIEEVDDPTDEQIDELLAGLQRKELAA